MAREEQQGGRRDAGLLQVVRCSGVIQKKGLALSRALGKAVQAEGCGSDKVPCHLQPSYMGKGLCQPQDLFMCPVTFKFRMKVCDSLYVSL